MTQARPPEEQTLGPLVRVAVVVLLLLLATAGVKSWRDLSEVRALESSLEAEIAETEESIQILEDRLERIDHDPATLERLAREELGMVRDGDLVVVFTPPRGSEDGGSGGEDGDGAPSDGAPSRHD